MLNPIQAGGGGSPPAEAGTPVHVARLGDTVESLLERFGLTDESSRRAFLDANPRLARGGLVPPGLVVRLPATAQTEIASPANATASVETAWTKGFGRAIAGQNDYNEEVRAALSRWPEADPLILKSILAQETGFDRRAFAANPYGYAGIAQLGIAEAREAGLRTGGSRNRRGRNPPVYDRTRDERFDPSKAIPAAAVVLRNKELALKSGVTLRSGLSLPGYEAYGHPVGDERWRFAAAAYNGGQGTILRAMRHAYADRPPSAVRWSDLVKSPTGDVRQSPLWLAIAEAGMNPRVKFAEISQYAENVVARARQQ